jgi:hypothetical protein
MFFTITSQSGMQESGLFLNNAGSQAKPVVRAAKADLAMNFIKLETTVCL